LALDSQIRVQIPQIRSLAQVTPFRDLKFLPIQAAVVQPEDSAAATTVDYLVNFVVATVHVLMGIRVVLESVVRHQAGFVAEPLAIGVKLMKFVVRSMAAAVRVAIYVVRMTTPAALRHLRTPIAVDNWSAFRIAGGMKSWLFLVSRF
jgi:hypothetical protein